MFHRTRKPFFIIFQTLSVLLVADTFSGIALKTVIFRLHIGFIGLCIFAILNVFTILDVFAVLRIGLSVII